MAWGKTTKCLFDIKDEGLLRKNSLSLQTTGYEERWDFGFGTDASKIEVSILTNKCRYEVGDQYFTDKKYYPLESKVKIRATYSGNLGRKNKGNCFY